MATFVDDTFTDTNGTDITLHTGETGATWTAHPSSAGTMQHIDSNALHDQGTSNNIAYASGTPAGVEYTVSANATWATAVGFTGLCARMDTSANTFYMYRATNGTTMELFKRIAGTFTSLGTATVTALNGTTHDCLFECKDATKKGFHDGVEILSSTDNAITAAGRAGVRGNGSSATVGAHLNNFTATDIGGGAAAVQQLFALMGVGS
jgi:hypothetical protein